MAQTLGELGAFHATPEGGKIAGDLNRRLSTRRLAPIPESIVDMSRKTQVYIFNVGPWSHMQLMGSLGRFHIPACKPTHLHGDPVIIPGIPIEQYPMNEAQCTALMEDGWETAHQIIGVGKHLAPANSLVKYGVAVSREWPPSHATLKDANDALFKHYNSLVDEANAAYASGPNVASETIRPEQHFLAARALKKTTAECPWLNRSMEQAERANCPGCGVIYTRGIMRCACGMILDKKAFEKAVAEGLFPEFSKSK